MQIEKAAEWLKGHSAWHSACANGRMSAMFGVGWGFDRSKAMLSLAPLTPQWLKKHSARANGRVNVH